MAFKTIRSPFCPEGRDRSQVHGQGTKKLKSGTTRQWRCRYVEEDGTLIATSSTDESPHSRRGSPRHVVAGRTSG
jgi:hypothetical protein